MKHRFTAILCTAFMAFTGVCTAMPDDNSLAASSDSADTASYLSKSSKTDLENPFDKQDNKEVVYDDSKWQQPKWLGNVPIDPNDYKGNAKVWFDKVTISYEEAMKKAKDAEPITINLNVSGVENTVCDVRFHCFHDTRLYSDITRGDALVDLVEYSKRIANGLYVLDALEVDDKLQLQNGIMWSIDFVIPKNVQPGDLYPIGIQYVEKDRFIDNSVVRI